MDVVIPGAVIGAIVIGGAGLYRYLTQQRQQKADMSRYAPIIDRAVAHSQAAKPPVEPAAGPADDPSGTGQ